MGDFFAPFLLVAALALDAFVAALETGPPPSDSHRLAASNRTDLLRRSVRRTAGGRAAGSSAPACRRPSLRLRHSRSSWGRQTDRRASQAAARAARPVPRRAAPFSPGALLSIYCRPDCADRDCSRTLSPERPARWLWLFRSTGRQPASERARSASGPLSVLLISIAVHLAGIRLGEAIGRRLARTVPVPLAPLCGAMLILLALLQFYG